MTPFAKDDDDKKDDDKKEGGGGRAGELFFKQKVGFARQDAV